MADRPLLRPCPPTPNCVSTEARKPGRRMEPFPYTDPPATVVARLADIVEAIPGGRVVERGDDRIRAEFTSRLFRFVDDVDLVLDRDTGVVRFRSASRVGRWDLGANRRRMERIRAAFLAP